jgi:hypothetical protein
MSADAPCNKIDAMRLARRKYLVRVFMALPRKYLPNDVGKIGAKLRSPMKDKRYTQINCPPRSIGARERQFRGPRPL